MTDDLRDSGSRGAARRGAWTWGALAALALAVSAGDVRPARASTIANVFYNPATGHYYKFVSSSGTWSAAKTGCETLGGYLCSLTSSPELTWVLANVGTGSNSVWLGGTDEAVEGTWVWVNGDSWSYTNWNSGEPNNSGNEDYLMMYSNGTWNDANGTYVLPGYIVEWDVNPNIPPPPVAPTVLTATLGTGNHVLLSWTDNSSNEASFEIQRKASAPTFGALASVAANGTTYDDGNVFPQTQYTYRVRAVNAGGPSGWSNEASATIPTMPTAPVAPSDLAGVASTASSVTIQWTDNSDNENGFEIQRKTPAGTYLFLGTVNADVLQFTDSGLPPDTTFDYRVRAVNASGASAFNEAFASTAPTLGVTPVKGDLKDSPKFGKDSLKFTASYEFLEGASDGTADPVAEGITVRAGTDASPVVLGVPPQADGWKGKKSKWTWGSPRGSLTKLKIVVDVEKHVVTVSATGLDLAVPAANPVRLSLVIGNDGGTDTRDWTPSKKPGVLSFR